MILLLRYDSAKHSYKHPLSNLPGLRFVASPEITAKLYIMPIEDDKDVVPPSGSLEKASAFYLIVNISGETSQEDFCSGCKNISGTLTALSTYDLEMQKFTKLAEQITTLRKEQKEQEDDDGSSGDEDSSCFFCKAFNSGATMAYSSFAFATSANASVTVTPILEAYLASVVVAKDWRNKKLCSALLRESFADLQTIHKKDLDLKRIRLHVRSDLPFLKRMYEKFGFVVRRNCPRYYPALKLDAVEMLLDNFDKKNFDQKESGARRDRDQ